MTAPITRFVRPPLALLAIVLASVAASLVAQEPARSGGLRLRDIVLAKLPPEAKVMGLDFTIEHVDQNNMSTLVNTPPEEYPFKIGDRFCVKIKTQDDLFVYVFTEGPTGTRKPLLPAAGDPPLKVRAGEEVVLPVPTPNGRYFEFADPAGEEKLLVVALPEFNPNIAEVLKAAFNQQPATKLKSNEDAKQQDPGAQAADVSAATAPDGKGLAANAAQAPDAQQLANLLSNLDISRPTGLRKRGRPSLVKQAAADLTPIGKNSAQIEMVPTQTDPTTQVVGVNASHIIVGIAMNTKPKANESR